MSTSSSGLAFRGWSYTITAIIFDSVAFPRLADSDNSVCLDTGCEITLVDRLWLEQKLSSQIISTIPVLLKVRGIGASRHKSGEFALTTIYIPGVDKTGREVYASISCKLHLFNGLKTNMLVGNNVLYMEGFAINLSTSSALVQSCGVSIDISARQHSEFLRQKVLASDLTLVPPQSEALIAFQQIHLPNSRDFLFHPSSQ